MSVYIKDMEMPKNCIECKFFAWKRGVGQHCAVDDRITFHATIDGMDVTYERNGNCPLVPVPPHGRLIDADALEELVIKQKYACAGASAHGSISELHKSWGLHDAELMVEAAPTIIPASEEGET